MNTALAFIEQVKPSFLNLKKLCVMKKQVNKTKSLSFRKFKKLEINQLQKNKLKGGTGNDQGNQDSIVAEELADI